VTVGVGVIARAPSHGGKTRLAGDVPEDRLHDLRVAMLADTLAVVRGLADCDPVIFFTPSNAAPEVAALAGPKMTAVAQGDGDLGARMHAAIEHLLIGRGSSAAILVGTDIPLLTTADLSDARDAMFGSDVVIGPANDGGYYLIGMKHVQRDLFRGMSWGSGIVLDESLRTAERLGLRVQILRALYDVDTPADLRRLSADLDRAPADVAPNLRRWITKDRDARSTAGSG
jgi:rSAM/selenodomain-associated transferase 1